MVFMKKYSFLTPISKQATPMPLEAPDPVRPIK
jgi:hypothetical protein